MSASEQARVVVRAEGLILRAWCRGGRLRRAWARIRGRVVIGALFFLLGHGSLHWAELHVPSGLAALLIAIEPIIVFALSSLAERRWRVNATLLAWREWDCCWAEVCWCPRRGWRPAELLFCWGRLRGRRGSCIRGDRSCPGVLYCFRR